MSVTTGLFSIISWAYFGRVSLTSTASTDPKLVATTVAAFAACYIWAGAISAALSSSRQLIHAVAAGVVMLLWSCGITLVTQPLVVSHLVVALTLSIPLAAWGARLQQAMVQKYAE